MKKNLKIINIKHYVQVKRFSVNGFDVQERKPTSSLKTKISCLQNEAIFLSFSQTKYCASLTTQKYFYASFPFGTWLTNLLV